MFILFGFSCCCFAYVQLETPLHVFGQIQTRQTGCGLPYSLTYPYGECSLVSSELERCSVQTVRGTFGQFVLGIENYTPTTKRATDL